MDFETTYYCYTCCGLYFCPFQFNFIIEFKYNFYTFNAIFFLHQSFSFSDLFFLSFFFSNWVLNGGRLKFPFFPPQTYRVTHFALDVLERRKIFSNFSYEKSQGWLGLAPRRFLIVPFPFFHLLLRWRLIYGISNNRYTISSLTAFQKVGFFI